MGRLHCYDEQTGDELWTQSYEVQYEEWAFDPTQEIGPVATPIVQDGKVYTVGRVGDLYCLDAATGEIHWHKSLGEEYEVQFAPGAPSPLIEGDLLILMAGGKNGACIVAMDKNSGAEAWTALDEKMTYSSPIVITSGGVRQLIVWTERAVTSLDPATGTVYWRQELFSSSDYIVSTPVFQGDRLLIGGLMFALNADHPGAVVLWPDPGEPASTVYSDTSTALLQGGYVYSALSSGQLICADASTGEQVWESNEVTRIGGGASIHIAANGDSVLLYTDRGELIRARLSAEGYSELSRAALLEPTMPFGGANVAWSPPALANGQIFARSGTELVCASLKAAP
jgi:outer membrane protein assembly factor BamB